MVDKTPEEVQKIIDGTNCRIVTLKRFIVAETILGIAALVTLIYLFQGNNIPDYKEIVGGWIILAGAVSTYYFKAIADENKASGNGKGGL